MLRRFVLDAGDFVWMEFSPQVGHEQVGHRPALVLSPAGYNSKTRTKVCCPMINQIKGSPFKVITHADGFYGAALSDQVRNIDWHTHKATPKGKESADELDEVRARISVLPGI
jgi:mRNA interferase MazF